MTPNTAGAAGPTAVQGPTGSGLPASNIPVAYSAVLALGVAAGALVVFRVAFKGDEIPVIRVDVPGAAAIYASWLVINIPIKLLAYHFHGHSAAQAILTFT